MPTPVILYIFTFLFIFLWPFGVNILESVCLLLSNLALLVHLEITSEVHGAEKPPTRRSPAGVEALVAKLRYQVVFAHLARQWYHWWRRWKCFSLTSAISTWGGHIDRPGTYSTDPYSNWFKCPFFEPNKRTRKQTYLEIVQRFIAQKHLAQRNCIIVHKSKCCAHHLPGWFLAFQTNGQVKSKRSFQRPPWKIGQSARSLRGPHLDR